MRIIRKLAVFLLIVVLAMVLLTFCSEDLLSDTQTPADAEASTEESEAASAVPMTESEETWAIYWYLCGSDLESDYGAASADLDEALAAALTDKVQVVVQTGGAYEWTNEIDPDVIQRYCISSAGMELVDEQPQANMGAEDTLAEFLSFCEENYPADHVAVIFWNHGGGTMGGVAYDELYDYDSLSLAEIHEAFAQVYTLSDENPPIDLLGFDACLMASIDTASMAEDIAAYMVASEESEPGNGWEYTGILNGLSRNTGMDGATLGRLICDTFLEGCEEADAEDEVTLSVIDLQKLPALLTAYDDVGGEALNSVYENLYFYTQFSRCAESAENYGGNTLLSGYSNMVDLGDLVRQSSSILPEHSEALLTALDDCVVYQVNGPYRENASGLSCYHAYDGSYESYELYSAVASSETFSYFYEYGLTTVWPDEATEYLEESSGAPATETPTTQPGTANTASLEDYPLYLREDGSAVLDLGEELASNLTTVLIHLAYVDEELDSILDLGSDSDLYGDWSTGVFSDNFYGQWGSIDGYLCYREVVYEGEDYTLYAVPILLNGEECILSVVYDYTEESYDILGAHRCTEEDYYMADKYLLQLQPGDEITTLHYATSISGDDDLVQAEVDTFTVTEETEFYDVDMGEGTFILFFDMIDAQNNSYLSAPVYFTVSEDGEIFVELD